MRDSCRFGSHSTRSDAITFTRQKRATPKTFPGNEQSRKLWARLPIVDADIRSKSMARFMEVMSYILLWLPLAKSSGSGWGWGSQMPCATAGARTRRAAAARRWGAPRNDSIYARLYSSRAVLWTSRNPGGLVFNRGVLPGASGLAIFGLPSVSCNWCVYTVASICV